MQNESAGFFLTEQPIVADADDRKNMVKIPDLLGARNDQES